METKKARAGINTYDCPRCRELRRAGVKSAQGTLFVPVGMRGYARMACGERLIAEQQCSDGHFCTVQMEH